MSRLAEKRTNEIVGELNVGDHTDHSGHNARWCNFRDGYDQAVKDVTEMACDAYCIMCLHTPPIPFHICRTDCEKYKNFRQALDTLKEGSEL